MCHIEFVLNFEMVRVRNDISLKKFLLKKYNLVKSVPMNASMVSITAGLDFNAIQMGKIDTLYLYNVMYLYNVYILFGVYYTYN